MLFSDSAKIESIIFEGSDTDIPVSLFSDFDKNNQNKANSISLNNNILPQECEDVPAGTYKVIDTDVSSSEIDLLTEPSGHEYALFVYDSGTPTDNSDDTYSAVLITGTTNVTIVPSVDFDVDGNTKTFPVEVIAEDAFVTDHGDPIAGIRRDNADDPRIRQVRRLRSLSQNVRHNFRSLPRRMQGRSGLLCRFRCHHSTRRVVYCAGRKSDIFNIRINY